MNRSIVPPTSAGTIDPRPIPFIKGSPLLGILPQSEVDLIGLLEESHSRYGNLVEYNIPLPGIRAFGITDPELIKTIFLNDEDNFIKHPMILTRFQKSMGIGLFTVSGDQWGSIRKRHVPAFSNDSVKLYEPAFQQETDAFLNRVRALPERSPFNIYQEFSRLSIAITARSLFSAPWINNYEDLAEVFEDLQDYAKYLADVLIPTPLFIPTKRSNQFKKAIRDIDKVVAEIVSYGRQQKGNENDLLAAIVNSTDEWTGKPLNNKQIRGEIINTLFAGYDTTSTTLTYAIKSLWENPTVLTKLKEEIDQQLQGKIPTLNDISKLTYCQNVIAETLRLYPSAYAQQRTNKKDFEYKGNTIPKGSLLFICAWMTHRDPEHWVDPLTFEPDRFLPEIRKTRHRFSYFPFSIGPRICIGKNMATMEATYVLTRLIQTFDVDIHNADKIRHTARITLRPTPGLLATLRLRTN